MAVSKQSHLWDGEAKPRLLVIDDNADVRESLRFLLEHEGHVVDAASDGYDGLILLQSRHPDAALVDLRMPGMDGFTFAKLARLLKYDEPLILIAVTAEPGEQTRLQAKTAGFDAHLTKPCTYGQIASALRTAAKTRSRAPPEKDGDMSDSGHGY